MRNAPRPRFPLTPVMPLLAAHAFYHGSVFASPTWALADLCRISRRTASRYIAEGMISDLLADRLACALGGHPLIYWPDYYDCEVG